MTPTKTPKLTVLGKPMTWEELEGAVDTTPRAVQAPPLDVHFNEVVISPAAINQASKIIPQEAYQTTQGLYSFLHERANYVFRKLPAGAKTGRLRKLEYFYEYDVKNPILVGVKYIH